MTTRTQAQVSGSQQSDALVTSSTILQPSREQTRESEQEGSLSDAIAEGPNVHESSFHTEFTRVPVSSNSMPFVQPKLVIGQPGDKYEQEADRVADQVMQMPDSVAAPLQHSAPDIQHYQPQLHYPVQRQLAESEMVPEPEKEEEKILQAKAIDSAPLIKEHVTGDKLQRQAMEAEEDDEEKTPVQAKVLSPAPAIKHFLNNSGGKLQQQATEEADEDETDVQPKANPAQRAAVPPRLETQISRSQSTGQPLSKSTQHLMESRFNHDFSRVRVHTDGTAAQMNHNLNAQAFTHGHDIYFGQGQYQPQTRPGQHLLAHELTHTIQQKPDVIKRFSNATPSSDLIQQQPIKDPPFRSVNHPVVQRIATGHRTVKINTFNPRPAIALRQGVPSSSAPPVFSSETTIPVEASSTASTASPTPASETLSPGISPASSPAASPEPVTDSESSLLTSATQATETTSAPSETVELEEATTVPAGEPAIATEETGAATAGASGGAEAEVATVEPLALEGSSNQAMVTFAEASPSQIAATQPSLGTALDNKIKQEQQTEAVNAPVLVAKTSGAVEEGLTPPEKISTSGDAQINDGVTEADPGELKPKAHENVGSIPTNKGNEKLLDRQDDNSFLDWFRNNTESFLSRIHTHSDVNTKVGSKERPKLELKGEADLERLSNQRGEAEGQLKSQRDDTVNTFKQHPGQKNIQPKAINEEKPTQVSPDAAVAIETAADTGAMDYARTPMSPEVRAHADELLKPTLSANLAAAKAETQNASKTKEDSKTTAVSQAEAEAAAVNQQADKDQRDVVVTNRQAVAQQQQAGIQGAFDEVNEFVKEADKEQTTNRQAIRDHVKEEEGKAHKEIEKGEEKAESEKKAKEKEADSKKQELERAQKNDSWWNRAVSAVKSAVKSITSAIDTIFTKLREAVKTIIEAAKNAAIGLINKARNWVIDKLNKFRDWAKNQVNKYLKDRFPGLAKRINEGIDGFVDTAIKGVNTVADGAIAAVEAVADGLAAALDKILSVYQTALKAAVQIAGAVITGDFAEALRVALQATCDIAGIDSKPIFNFVDRAAGQIMAILKNPKAFFKNVMAAIGGGVSNFAQNIPQHLVKGLVGWLTGALSEANLSLPETFDAPGILSLVMQILGLTYENIKAKVIKKYPPAAKVIDVVEKGFTIIKRLVVEGPMALWDEVKQKMSNLKEMVISGIKDFVIKTVVKEGIAWLLGLLTPVGAIAKLLKLIFDFVMFLVERFQQIKDFVMSVYNSIAAIAAGNLSQAKKAVEDALSRSLPVVISMLASLAGLGGIGKTVKNIIGKIANPVNKIIDGLVGRMVKFAKKLLKKGKAAAKKVKEKLFEWWKQRKKFKNKAGESHTIFFKGKGTAARLMIASKVTALDAYLNSAKGNPQKISAAKTIVKNLKVVTRSKVKPADARLITAEMTKLSTLLAEIMGSTADKIELPANAIWKFGGGINKFAQVEQLSTQTAKGGSGPGTSSPNGWGSISFHHLTDADKGQWVRMHMISAAVGGKGKDANLVPAPHTINTGASVKSFEDGVKDLVENPNQTTKKPNVVWIKTQVKRFHPASTTPPVPWGKTDFAHRVLFQAGLYFPTPATGNKINWAKDQKARISERVEIPPPNFGAGGKSSINIDGQDRISQAVDSSNPRRRRYFAEHVILERTINNSFQAGNIPLFEQRMRNYWKNELGRKTGKPFEDNLAAFKSALDSGDLLW